MDQRELARLRREYSDRGLGVTDLTADPLEQFTRWFDEIAAAVPKSDTSWFEANAVVLSTADEGGRPSSRTVLLKGYGAEGFTIFTNYTSRKGRELAANPSASLLFPWYPLERQVIVSGTASRLAESASDAYFASRPRGARLGAWASEQSAAIAEPEPGRAWLEERYREFDRRFPGEVPRPPHWGGIVIAPETVEFWQGRVSRLHDRLVYVRDGEKWRIDRLSP
ncbi:MAG TPA: pyridoxamine 5'-phosphate oxidase [Actinocrinis sp.]|jgi:pyridoxamine 5'-phosphate oxidase|uniref:pyridoxamine 5'-phosphate oxidase n=1 Tax=Actinocrinis sp. TaxID=1920516 RepID=UPI002DDDA248|nr:pyridoxamine 5'-phosphate oxidase [Actinocrinis sp.]HEV3172632.1 pyridoxamine 5'-phosphate oxidase [Actinocrinis sp.]